MAEGGHEHPQGGGVEEPVGGGPTDGSAGQGAVPHQCREAVGQPLHQCRGAIGIEEPDPPGHPPHDAAGPLLAPGEQVEEAAEGTEEDHADTGGHDDQDGGGLRLPAVVAGRCVKAVGDQEGHQRAPEHHVEHHRRADPLSPEGEPGIGPAHLGLGQQPVAQGGARSSPAGGDVTEGQGGHVDPEQAEPARAVVGQHGVGQLGVGHQGADLQKHGQGQVDDVNVGQGVHLGPVAGQEGQGQVEDEQEGHQRPDAQPDLTADERPPVPPPPARLGRHVCLLDLHHVHVCTPDPPGPDMLAW